jgi:hypothetical protein
MSEGSIANDSWSWSTTMYPYGEIAGDSAADFQSNSADNGWTAPINVSPGFQFFGNTENNITVIICSIIKCS